MKFLLRISLIIFFLAPIFFSCANDMNVVNKFIDTEIEPDVLSENVELLYSDSAKLQVKMLAPLVKLFSSAKEQRKEFPEGIHVWFYEKTGELKAEITANWAKHDEVADLWEAQSNVVITHANGDKLETEQFFWDTKKGIVYSEKYTKMTQEDGSMASGESFSANQDFTDMKFIRGKATIMINDEEKPENQP